MKPYRHLFLVFLASLSIFSCKNKPKPPVAEESEQVTPTVPQYLAEGIVIGENVRLRQDSSLKSPVIGSVSTGEMLQILGVGAVSYERPSGEFDCDAYPMVQVKTRDGKAGWVYGQYIYQILSEQTKRQNIRVYDKVSKDGLVDFEGRNFQLLLCRNYGPGAWDEDEGLTNCSEFYPVLLRDTKTGETFVVSLPKPQNIIPDFKYWCLESDEGAEESIKSIQTGEQGQLLVSVWAEHMTSCSKYQVEISGQSGRYFAKCINYQYFEETECK